jgi:hypothetical protein
MLPQPREQSIVDAERVDGQSPRVCERCFLRIRERAALEIEQRLQLILTCSMPRSLRGVRAVSILAAVQARDERRDQLLRADRHRSGIRDGIHVSDHRLQDLGPVRVDAEHVRDVSARSTDLRVELLNVAGDLVFREAGQT